MRVVSFKVFNAVGPGLPRLLLTDLPTLQSQDDEERRAEPDGGHVELRARKLRLVLDVIRIFYFFLDGTHACSAGFGTFFIKKKRTRLTPGYEGD